MFSTDDRTVLFAMTPHPLEGPVVRQLGCRKGELAARKFPDGESYLRVETAVEGVHCMLLADLADPDAKYLPLVYLAQTLRELGAASVGLIAPYLPYMRQDARFHKGEALTSRLFARELCRHVNWLVTVDPHLHRYHTLNEVYDIPNRVVQGAPALADWLGSQTGILLVGPDAESEQWVSDLAGISGHPYVIGSKHRRGDRDVDVTLPDLTGFSGSKVVIVDDVISSGQTILNCILALQRQGITDVGCAAVHGIFADDSDRQLMAAGLRTLATTNTVAHRSNQMDVSHWVVPAVEELIRQAMA